MAEVELPAIYLDALEEDLAPAVAGLTPTLINFDPEPDERVVPRTTNIVFDIATVDSATGMIDLNATVVRVNGVLAFNRGAFLFPYNGPRSTFSFPRSDVLRIRLDTVAGFESEAEVSVHVQSQAVGDANLLDETYHFYIEDYVGPRLVSAEAVDLNRIRVRFNEPLNLDMASVASAWTIDRFGDYVTPLVAAAVAAVEVFDVDTLDLITDIPLTPRGAYQVTAAGVQDASDNEITAPFNVLMFEGWAPPAPSGRAFDLYKKFPDLNKSEDETLDLLRLVGCIQEIADLLLYDIDNFIEIMDPDTAPEAAVDTMLLDLGNPFAFELSLTDKRRLCNVLVAMYQLKGTAPGIRNVVRFFLGLEVTINCYNMLDGGWMLGESMLGEETLLSSKLSANLYSFDVISPIVLDADTRAKIDSIVEYMKPCHTHYIKLVEPTVPVVESEFIPLGEALLGFNWRLGQVLNEPQTIGVQGIASFEYVGIPTAYKNLVQYITPAGLVTGAVVSATAQAIKKLQFISPSGIATSEALGSATLTNLFDPNYIASLVWRVRASQAVTSSGGTLIDSIPNEGSLGHGTSNVNDMAFSGARPKYTAASTTFNNKPAVLLDSATQALTTGNLSTPIAQPSTWYAYTNIPDTNVNAQVSIRLNGGTSANAATLAVNPSTDTVIYTEFGANPVVSSAMYGKKLVAVVYNGTSTQLFIDDMTTPVATAASGGTGACNTVKSFLGSSSLGPVEWVEQIAYSGVHNSTQRNQIKQYMQAVYGT